MLTQERALSLVPSFTHHFRANCRFNRHAWLHNSGRINSDSMAIEYDRHLKKLAIPH
jgi:hypothetical protein